MAFFSIIMPREFQEDYSMPGLRIIFMMLVISISTPALNDAQAKTQAKTQAKITAETDATVQSAWQSYLAGKHKRAAKQFKQLANEKNARAQNYLGSLYASGHGVKTNHKRAARWYERAAKQGFAAAQFNIGFLLLHGAGEGALTVYANPKAAARWLKKAAQQNEPDCPIFTVPALSSGPRCYA
jgi:uncharacterized protein